MSEIGNIIYRHINADREHFPHQARTTMDDAILEIDAYVTELIEAAAQSARSAGYAAGVGAERNREI